MIKQLFAYLSPPKPRFAHEEKIQLTLKKNVHLAPHIWQQQTSHHLVVILPTDILEYTNENEDYYFFVCHANRTKEQQECARNGSVIYISRDCFLNLKYTTL